MPNIYPSQIRAGDRWTLRTSDIGHPGGSVFDVVALSNAHDTTPGFLSGRRRVEVDVERSLRFGRGVGGFIGRDVVTFYRSERVQVERS